MTLERGTNGRTLCTVLGSQPDGQPNALRETVAGRAAGGGVAQRLRAAGRAAGGSCAQRQQAAARRCNGRWQRSRRIASGRVAPPLARTRVQGLTERAPALRPRALDRQRDDGRGAGGFLGREGRDHGGDGGELVGRRITRHDADHRFGGRGGVRRLLRPRGPGRRRRVRRRPHDRRRRRYRRRPHDRRHRRCRHRRFGRPGCARRPVCARRPACAGRLGRVPPAHSGMFPCFLAGSDARFVRSARNDLITAVRVAAGSMMPSSSPRSAARNGDATL